MVAANVHPAAVESTASPTMSAATVTAAMGEGLRIRVDSDGCPQNKADDPTGHGCLQLIALIS
jgi:hypothetical protein